MVIDKQLLLDRKLWDAVMGTGVRILATIVIAWLLHRLILSKLPDPPVRSIHWY